MELIIVSVGFTIFGMLFGAALGQHYCPECAEARKLREMQNRVDEILRAAQIKFNLKERQ